MSTFTQWNSPNAGAAANIPVQKFTELIAAYSKLCADLHIHIDENVNAEQDVHNVKGYVSSALKSFETELKTMFATPSLVAETVADLKKPSGDFSNIVKQWAINALAEPLAGKVDNQTHEQDIAQLFTKTDAGTLQQKVNTLTTLLNDLKESYDKFSKKVSTDDSDDENIIHRFDDTLEAATFIVEALKVKSFIDFTKWEEVALQYAGTGAIPESDGVFIIGKVSDDWEDKTFSQPKSCRVYLKYVNSHPFDAIIDVAVTKSDDGFAGNIQALVSTSDNFWENLRFHLVDCTDTRGKRQVYLALSSTAIRNLISVTTVLANALTFFVAGENFIPLTKAARIETVTGSVCYTTKMPIEKKAAMLTTTIAMDALAIDNVVDSNGNSLIKVLRNITDEDDLTKTYDVLQFGSDAFKFLQLLNRPIIFESPTDEEGNVIKDKNGNPIIEKHTLITDKDANRFSTPVGSIMFWSDFEEVTNGTDDEGNPNVIRRSAINVPKGWAALDGSILLTEGHEDFAALVKGNEDFAKKYPFTDEGKTSIQLPVVDFAIIKVTACKFETVYPEYSELIDLQNVINRVNNLAKDIKAKAAKFQEHDDRHDAQLAGNEGSGLKTLIEAEATTARANEGTLQTNINDERSRAEGAEGNLQRAIEAEATTARANERTLQTNIDNEEGRAKGEEERLQSAIEREATTRGEEDEDIRAALRTETDERESEDGLLSTLITNEHDRAVGIEGDLQRGLDTEKGRAETEEAAIRAELGREHDRAVGAEGDLQSGLNAANTRIDETNAALEAEKTTARANEQSLQKHIDDEAAMARANESALHDEVSDEYSRARGAERDLGTSITNVRGALNEEITNARQAESDITASLAAETDRATTEERRLNSQMSLKESALNTAIADESSRAQISEGNLRTKIENTKTELQSNIDTANSTRNEADVNLLKYIQETYLENKQVYRDRIELPNVTPDAKGNVWHTGDIAVLFDGTNIKTVTATVNGEIVTWSE